MAALKSASRLAAQRYSSITTQALNLDSPSRLIRPLAGPSGSSLEKSVAKDFLFWPAFLTESESREALKMAMWKLDRVDTTRKRRRKGKSKDGQDTVSTARLQDLFDGVYGFEEGHYDSVIHDYRETLLSSLPPSPSLELTAILARLYSLLPSTGIDRDTLPPTQTSTHLLHLSPRGSILPHVDNLQASGSVILGLSLGAERTMQLKRKDGNGGWDLRLPSGSVYLQRDSIRYEYEHSILPYDHEGSVWDEERLEAGHRISVMVRDAPSRPSEL